MKFLTLGKDHPTIYKSATMLADYINNKGLPCTTTIDCMDKDIKIRWGVSTYPRVEDTIYNDPKLISLSANKNSLNKLLKGNGIHCVDFYKDDMPEKYPVIVRRTIVGGGGKGIVICRNEEEFKPLFGNYWAYWFKFDFELGVHLLGGNVSRVFKKIKDQDEDEFPIRNVKNGYHYSLVSVDTYKTLPKLMSTIFEVFPIQMSRFDIGWDSENKVYRVIESNCCPILMNNQNTLIDYGEFLYEKLK